MKTLLDPDRALADGLTQIRAEFQVPDGFPPAVLAAAEAAVRRTPTQHVDRTQVRFVTLDPAASTDLDQAFAIEQAGADLLLHYAIADVGWFVEDGDSLDVEAWARGETLYLPDGKAGLYPSILSEGAAMLFLFPGLDLFMRINGRGRIVDDPAHCAALAEGAKIPKTAIVVAVDEVLFHCGKAVNRGQLWNPTARLDRKSLPTPGQNAGRHDQAGSGRRGRHRRTIRSGDAKRPLWMMPRHKPANCATSLRCISPAA